MGKYCLTKPLAKEFKRKIKSGEINPEKLSKMTSVGRRAFFAEFLGEYNAKNVNALFEKKLLQKNFWNAMLGWAKETSGIKEPIRKDLISRIEKMIKDKKGNILSPEEKNAFLQDLASAKLGADVNLEEAKKITKISSKMTESKKAYNPKTEKWSSEKDRLEYGKNFVELQEYLKELKLKTEKPTKRWISKTINYTAGTLKSIVASLDNSFFGRQGLKVLFNKPDIWAKSFLKSFSDIGKTLFGDDPIKAIKADIYSRPNAMNGNYRNMKLDIDLLSEEAFPSSLPEKIPLLGKLYKASENAYNGAALRMRADIADSVLDVAQKNGVDIEDQIEARSLGKLVNSLTGRGSIGRLEVVGKEINAALFSIKFLKSNFDVLTAHMLDRNMSKYAKKEAAKNLLRIVGGVAAILYIADKLWPDSVEKDPRSSNFGKIKIKNTRFDVSGGMAGIVTAASRLISGYSKSSTTDKVYKLGEGYKTTTRLDVLTNFFMNKTSPSFSIIRDLLKGEMFGGRDISVKNISQQSLMPISIQTWQELKNDPNSADNFIAMLAELTGISVNNYDAMSFDNWNRSTSKKLIQFKEIIGEKEFEIAHKKYLVNTRQKLFDLMNSNEYKKMNTEEKTKAISKVKKEEKENIFREYNFKYKREKKD